MIECKVIDIVKSFREFVSCRAFKSDLLHLICSYMTLERFLDPNLNIRCYRCNEMLVSIIKRKGST